MLHSNSIIFLREWGKAVGGWLKRFSHFAPSRPLTWFSKSLIPLLVIFIIQKDGDLIYPDLSKQTKNISFHSTAGFEILSQRSPSRHLRPSQQNHSREQSRVSWCEHGGQARGRAKLLDLARGAWWSNHSSRRKLGCAVLYRARISRSQTGRDCGRVVR